MKLSNAINTSQFEYLFSGIDGLVVATTPIFTTLPNSGNFFVTSILVILESVTGIATGTASFSVGFNGPAFDNIDNGNGANLLAAEEYKLSLLQTQPRVAAIPPSTVVTFNLLSAEATATSYVLGVKVLGNYI